MIDDFLPVNEYDKLIFSKNKYHKNEFWTALLEKAYAKVLFVELFIFSKP